MLGQLLDDRYEISTKLGEGAFGETYLAKDLKRPSKPHCVVKRLKTSIPEEHRSRIIEFFNQEAAILEKLGEHPQIPRLLAHFPVEDNLFIVQEYVAGHSLRREIAPGQPWQEEAVVQFLKETLEILAFVHHQNVIHRDLKPENIMRRSDGKLVLIDFGAVKELGTLMVTDQGAVQTSIVIGTTGYMSSEQAKGKPQLSSDVYALGIMAIEALTGVPAAYLQDDPQTGELLWRHQAQVSEQLATVIDRMVRDHFTRRFPSALEALQALNQAMGFPSILPSVTPISGVTTLPPSTLPPFIPTSPSQPLPATHVSTHQHAAQTSQQIPEQTSERQTRQRRFPQVLLGSLLIAAGVLGVRSLGLLQPLELKAFDALMQLRPTEPLDDRLLIVTIDEAERQQYGGNVPGIGTVSLSDRYLNQLIQQLQQQNAALIGIDLYRDFPVDATQASLANTFQNNAQIVTLCKSQFLGGDSIAPPPDVPLDRVGFSDFVVDGDNTLRRHLVTMTPELIDPNAPCTASYAFSTQLALRYLKARGISTGFTPDGNLQLGEQVLPRLQANTGSYRGIDAQGNQILLNYRAADRPARTIPLTQVLTGQLNSAFVQNRIVLIGVTATSTGDIWETPIDRQMPGVFIQAHMVSQLLGVALNERPWIWVWSAWGEILWISLWSILGGLMAWWLRWRGRLGIGVIVGVSLLSGMSWLLMTQSGWIPFLPALLGFLIASGAIATYLHISTSSESKS